MKSLFSTLIILVIALAIFSLKSSHDTPALASGPEIPHNFIFAPDTSNQYLEDVYDSVSGGIGPSYFLGDHWDPTDFFNPTATADGGAAQGDSLTLTWSIIPDGTNMPASDSQDTTCNSSLISDFNTKYGAGNWQNEIRNVFADWSSKTGNVYVEQGTDDGAAWPTSPGVLGVRGDIRIGGCTIDGDSNILAYNFFPNNGDMKIDSKDAFYDGFNLTTTFHNVISHEHGHGVAVAHVCPINQTKLMEPFVTSAFKGLQHDDIRAIQRHHGDRNELIGADNDVSGRATNLGTPTNDVPTNVQGISIDDNGDTDWFKFNVAGAGAKVDVSVTPIGSTYLNGQQNGDGSCSAGTPFNSLAVHNLGFEIRDSDGTTVLATGNANPAGVAEALTTVSLGAAGTKYIRVFGDSTDDIQLYDLQVTVRGPILTASITPDPDPILATTTLVTYSLTIQNSGGIAATNVLITNTIPASTTYVPASASDGGSHSAGVIVWPATTINVASSVIRTFQVTVTNPITDGDKLINTVSASSAEGAVIQNQAISEIVNKKTTYLPILFKN